MKNDSTSYHKDTAVLSVGALTRLIRGALEDQFDELVVEGEISNLSLPLSGHAYFTLKDETAQISAVIWRSDLQRLRCKPRDGMQGLVRGRLTVYEKRGAYQLVVRSLEEAGLGALFQRFEQLKKALAEEGLFDAAHKRALPTLPQHVGVVTSPTGAAIRDIVKVIKRRFPNMHIVLAPVRVQGEGAAEEIAGALDLLNQRGGLDVMIVGRGGGSFEELYCFNEEVVARAIARSAIPVISAVGHEVDFTISDFVADIRAPTPSAAAEMVVASKAELNSLCIQWQRRLEGGMLALLERARRRLEKAQSSYVFHEPGHMVRVVRERLILLGERMAYGLTGRLHEGQQRLDDAAARILRGMRLRPERSRQEMRRLADQLRVLNPLGVLERGYSITRAPDGAVLRDVSGVKPGIQVITRLARGEFESEVKKIHDATQNENSRI